MRTRSFARIAVLVAVASVVAGCSSASGSATGDDSPPMPPLQLRLVTSSAEGPCSASPLTSDGAGSACDSAGTTTYALGESLGVVTPTSVTRDSQGTGQTVVVEFDKADTDTLSEVTGEAVEKQLAILLDGEVLSAVTVKSPITDGAVTFAFATAAEAEQVAAELGASATS